MSSSISYSPPPLWNCRWGNQPSTETRKNGGGSKKGEEEEGGGEGGRREKLSRERDTGGNARDQPVPALVVSPVPEEEVCQRVAAAWAPPAGQSGSSLAGGCRRAGLTVCSSVSTNNRTDTWLSASVKERLSVVAAHTERGRRKELCSGR